MDYALDMIKMLNEITVYEAIGEQPPKMLVRKLQAWQRGVEKNRGL